MWIFGDFCEEFRFFGFADLYTMAPPSADNNGIDEQRGAPVQQQQQRIGRLVPRPEGPACVLAIATAYPPTVIQQDTYHDKLFELCNVGDDVVLKGKFKRMCKCILENKYVRRIQDFPRHKIFRSSSLVKELAGRMRALDRSRLLPTCKMCNVQFQFLKWVMFLDSFLQVIIHASRNATPF